MFHPYDEHVHCSLFVLNPPRWCFCSMKRQAAEGGGENSHTNKRVLSAPEAARPATFIPAPLHPSWPPSTIPSLPLSQWIYYPLLLSAGLLNGPQLFNFMPQVNLVMVAAELQWRGPTLFISLCARGRRHRNESERATQRPGGIIRGMNANRFHLLWKELEPQGTIFEVYSRTSEGYKVMVGELFEWNLTSL